MKKLLSVLGVRHPGDGRPPFEIQANVFTVNEQADDLFNTLKTDDRVCLKGSLSLVGGRQIYVCAAKRE